MNTKVLIVALISLTIAACNKDQFTTKPQLTFKQVNQTEYHLGDIIEFQIDYTDKEGDIQNKLYLEEVTNDKDCPDNNFKSFYQVPTDLPDQSQGKEPLLSGTLMRNLANTQSTPVQNASGTILAISVLRLPTKLTTPAIP